MFTVFQTIPVLVRSPQPLGFGGSAITSAYIQLPFMIVFLLFAPSSGFIVSRLGNVKPTLIGSIVSTIGFFSLFMFHSTEFLVATNLAIIAARLSLIQVGGFDIVLQSTPRQFSGISLGMTVLFNLIGGSIGPAVAGLYMQSHQVIKKDVIGSFPSPESYSLIFLTITLTSLFPIVLAFYLRKKATPSRKQFLSIFGLDRTLYGKPKDKRWWIKSTDEDNPVNETKFASNKRDCCLS